MTTDEKLDLILARLDGLEADMAGLNNRAVTLDDRTVEMAGALDAIARTTEGIRDGVVNLTGAVDEMGRFDEAAFQLEELIEADRRRERREWRDGARAAMGRAS